MRRYKSIFALSIAFAADVFAADAAPTFMERLAAREKEIQDVRFTYTQSVEILSTRESRISRGRFVFQRPNRFRMERETEKEVLVSDGQTLFIYQKSRGICVKKSARDFETEGGAAFPLEALFGGINALQRRFEVSLTTTADKGAVLEIRPRGAAHWKTKVFLKEDALPKGFEVQTQAIRIRTTLSQIALNHRPSEKEFRLTLPKSVEVFEE